MTTQVRSDDNSGMDDKLTKRERGGAAAFTLLAAVLVILPMAYVLSTGPGTWLLQADRVDKSWIPVVLAFYRPITWIERNVPYAREPLASYRYWWLTKKRPQPRPNVTY